MTEGEDAFMKKIMETEIPEVEQVYVGSPDRTEDLAGRIASMRSEVQALEGRYNEADGPVIDAKNREILKLEEELRSKSN